MIMQKQIALVTGGTSGIGLGIVKIFAESGYHVVFCGKPSENIGYQIEKEINTNLEDENYPGNVTFIPCDLMDEDSIKDMVKFTIAKCGHLDVLVNNAGSHPPPQIVDTTGSKEFRDLFNLNVLGYFLTSKYSLPYLRETKGSIIFNSSLVAQIGQLHSIPYVATKGAVTSMARAMSIDEAEHGVRVNCVSPSNIWTPLWQESCKLHIDPASHIKSGEDAQLMGRMGTPEEVGKLCLFLARDADFMTGVDIPISGGAELNYGLKSRVS